MNWKHALWRTISRVAGRPSPRTGLRVLGYHAVGTELPGDPYGLSVDPALFTRQMELVASGRFGRPVGLGSAKLDGSAEIAVTFDDGYQDALKTAAPILARLSLPFTVCVTPCLLDSGRPHLSWPELKELSAMPGCEIGAHGLTHARLDALGDAELSRELTESRRRLEDALGRPVTVMTWPHGAASQRTAAAARAAGFTRAGCSLYGVNGPDRDPLLLRRTEIVAFDDERDFVGKASGTWDWFALRQPDPARQ
ncbi:MAG: hypothetical protein A2V88_07215 [Elusimicrobia bacterium RBG_16_66_12]|nr:MAG: hypothetical protein A2V88_07215 [Elusimicrobia bacterium RBG_16_66_12]